MERTMMCLLDLLLAVLQTSLTFCLVLQVEG